jgi:hypothetical protein
MRIALLLAVLVAAVGSSASEAAPASTPGTELRISYWPEGRDSGQPTKWILRCNPAGGTMPQAAGVCRRLVAMTKPFTPMGKNLVCTDLYGGPQQAVITGTFKGSRVWTQLGMRNGCEISRAKRLAFLVPGFSASVSS